jgi:tight adherence protein B
MEMILIFGIGFAMVILVVGVLITVREERSLVEDRLGKYMKEEQERRGQPKQARAGGERVGQHAHREVLLGLGHRQGAGAGRYQAEGGRVHRHGLWRQRVDGAGGLLLRMAPGSSLGIGFVLGAFLPRIYINMQKGKRLVRFNNQLADMLNLMVNGLRAGYSTMQAMEAVSKELPAPISEEFRRVVQEMQLGVTMEQALDNLLRASPAWTWTW